MTTAGGARRRASKVVDHRCVVAAKGVFAFAVAGLGLINCSDEPPVPGTVSSDEPKRLFYYAEPVSGSGDSQLMAVDPVAGELRIVPVDVDPAIDLSGSATACSANAWDASWSSVDHRALGIVSRGVVLASEPGHLYVVPRSLRQVPRPRRISAEQRAASVDDCRVWPNLADYGDSLVLYQRGYRPYYASLAEGVRSLPRVLPSSLGYPLRDTATGGLAGYLYVGGSAIRLAALDRGGARTLKAGVERLTVAGPLGRRYVLLADGEWYAFDPKAAPGEWLVSLDAQRSVGWFAGPFTRLGTASQARDEGYLVTGQNTGRSFIVSVGFDRRPAVRLRARPGDLPLRLLGQHEHERTLAFRYAPGFGGGSRGEFVSVDLGSGSIQVLAEGRRFANGMVPTHGFSEAQLTLAGVENRPTVVRFDDSSVEHLGGEDAYLARQAVDRQYAALTAGSLVRGERLVYLDGNRVYSVDASQTNPLSSRLLLGKIRNASDRGYQAAYKTGDDEGGLLFLKRPDGEPDVAYIHPERSESLEMLVADPDRAAHPVNGATDLWP